MNVVGVDLSLRATGVACGDGSTLTIQTKQRGMDRLTDLRSQILVACSADLHSLLTPDLVCIEGYSYGSKFSHAHALGELGGVIRLALHEANVPYVDIPPTVVKKYATGRGNASKGEMLAAAIRRLDYQGASDNEADALWLREMGLDWATGLAHVPNDYRTALDRVGWPDARTPGAGAA